MSVEQSESLKVHKENAMVPKDLKEGDTVGHIKGGVVRKVMFERKDPSGKYIFNSKVRLGPFTISLSVVLDEQAVLTEVEPLAHCC